MSSVRLGRQVVNPGSMSVAPVAGQTLYVYSMSTVRTIICISKFRWTPLTF